MISVDSGELGITQGLHYYIEDCSMDYRRAGDRIAANRFGDSRKLVTDRRYQGRLARLEVLF